TTIDSLDDWALAQRVDRVAAGKLPAEPMRVLIEVHLGGEETKSGVTEGELPSLAERILQLDSLRLAGLMCIPPFLEDPEEVRPYFARLRLLRDALETRLGQRLPVLSMGMSHDFEAAFRKAPPKFALAPRFLVPGRIRNEFKGCCLSLRRDHDAIYPPAFAGN